MQNRKRNRKANKNNTNQNKRRKVATVSTAPKKKRMRGNAPAAVSDDLQQFVRFMPGSKESHLKVCARVPLYFVNSNYHDGTNLIRGGLSLTSTNSFPYIALSSITGIYAGGGTDVVKNYISPVFNLIGSAFTRYKIKGCKFLYEPQSSTQTSDRLVFAYANDPEHPLIKATPAAASQGKLLALADSMSFAPWKTWELDVSQEVNQDLLYTYNQDNTETDNRFNMFGSIGCIPSVEPTSTTAMTVYGVLYAELCFEFVEFCPIIQGFTPTLFVESLKQEGVLSQDGKKCSIKKEKLEALLWFYNLSKKDRRTIMPKLDECDCDHDSVKRGVIACPHAYKANADSRKTA